MIFHIILKSQNVVYMYTVVHGIISKNKDF